MQGTVTDTQALQNKTTQPAYLPEAFECDRSCSRWLDWIVKCGNYCPASCSNCGLLRLLAVAASVLDKPYTYRHRLAGRVCVSPASWFRSDMSNNSGFLAGSGPVLLQFYMGTGPCFKILDGSSVGQFLDLWRSVILDIQKSAILDANFPS